MPFLLKGHPVPAPTPFQRLPWVPKWGKIALERPFESYSFTKLVMQPTVSVVHNKVPSRIRFRVPMIKDRRTIAELLKQSLLKDPDGKGIYHAEPNITTGTILVKYHPALHTEEAVVRLVQSIAAKIAEGKVEISAKHKNPRVGRMQPGAFFTRELLVSIGGNVIAGLLLAAIIAR